MRVRITKVLRGDTHADPGDVIDVPAEQGQQLLDASAAEMVVPPREAAAEVAVEAPAEEKAAKAPKKRARRRKA